MKFRPKGELRSPLLRRLSEKAMLQGRRLQFKSPTAWKAAHADRFKHVPKANPNAVTRKVLVVTDDQEVFTATWELRGGIWSCREASHRFGWMLKKSLGDVHLTLIKMGLDYRWEPFPKVSDPSGVKHVTHQHVAGNTATGNKAPAERSYSVAGLGNQTREASGPCDTLIAAPERCLKHQGSPANSPASKRY